MTSETRIYQTKHLTFGYILALVILAMLFIIAYALIRVNINRQAADAPVINLAGRQRMLSQEITKEVLHLMQSDNQKITKIHYQGLADSVENWTRVHLGLQHGDVELRLPGNNSTEVKQLFTDIEPYYQALKSSIDEILEKDTIYHHSNPLSRATIEDISKNSSLYLELMDQIVSQYEKEAQFRVNKLKNYQTYIVISLLALLFIESRFIFQPMISKVQETYLAFQQTNEKLKQEISEREQAEKALKRSEINSRAIVSTVGEGIITIGSDSHIRFVNQELCNIFGYTEEELLGRDLTKIIPEKYRPAHSAGIMKRYLSGGVPGVLGRRLELEGLHRDGSVFPVELRIEQTIIEEERFFTAAIRDIVERKRVEEELDRRSKFIKLLQEISSQANLSQSIEEVLQFTIVKVCALTSWPVGHVYMVSDDNPDLLKPTSIWNLKDETRYKVFHDATMSRDFSKGEGLPGRVLASGKPAWITDVMKDPNFPRAAAAKDIGVKAALAFPILLRNSVAAVLEFYSPDSTEPDEQLLEIMGQIGTQASRVIERMQAEEGIRQSKKKYETLIDNTSSVIYTLSADGKITFISKAIEKLSGYKIQSFPSSNILWERLLNYEDIQKFITHRQTLIANKLPSNEHYRLKAKDGSTVWVEDQCVPIKDADGNVIYFHGTMDNITQMKNLEQFREDFFQTVIHDLKSPITGIKLELESINSYLKQVNNCIKDKSDKLMYGTLEDAIKTKIKNTNSGLDDIYRMIEGLLKIGEIEEEKLEVSYESFDINELFQELKLEFKERLQKKRLELEINSQSVGDTVCDRRLLKRVFQNLVDNAVKYSYASSKIVIDSSCDRVDGYDFGSTLVTISNTGEPLSEKKVNSMFNKFRTQNEPESGSGIGLFFCWKAMEALEGGISINAEGNKTEFYVYYRDG